MTQARRHGRVNVEWETPANAGYGWEHVAIEVMMDIRAELRALNSTLNCPSTRDIPVRLRAIERKMPAQKKARK